MSRWSLWGAERGWADVGLWVAVCFLAKISSHRPTCKTRLARLTQSQAISQSFRVFISFTSRRDTTFFHFSKLFFYTKLPFSLPWWSKDPLVDKHAGGGQSTSKSTCEVPARTLTAYLAIDHPSSMSKWRPAWTLTPKLIPFPTKSVTLSMLIDLLTSTMSFRSTQAKIASTDLWPQEMFTLSKMLALVESESSFGAYVGHRRPGGYTATSDLVVYFSYREVRVVFPLQVLNSKAGACHNSKRAHWFVARNFKFHARCNHQTNKLLFV